jgi:hypothetical protein
LCALKGNEAHGEAGRPDGSLLQERHSRFYLLSKMFDACTLFQACTGKHLIRIGKAVYKVFLI